MNNIFEGTVGGVLVKDQHPICITEKCIYTMVLKMEKIKLLSIESTFTEINKE